MATDVGAALRRRSVWAPGSMVEVYSSSLGRWCIGFVAHINKDQLLTVRFYDHRGPDGPLLAKNLARSDLQIAVFGSNLMELPPGFRQVPSQSRPGDVTYLDTASGMKFQGLELAWRHQLEKMLDPSVDPRR